MEIGTAGVLDKGYADMEVLEVSMETGTEVAVEFRCFSSLAMLAFLAKFRKASAKLELLADETKAWSFPSEPVLLPIGRDLGDCTGLDFKGGFIISPGKVM